MCLACSFPRATGHWSDAGIVPSSGADRRDQTLDALRRLLSASGLSVGRAAPGAGFLLRTAAGRTAGAATVDEVWPLVQHLTGRPWTPSMRLPAAWPPIRGMSGDAAARVRLTVLGGFLGAGKSTWLRHQIRVRRVQRCPGRGERSGRDPRRRHAAARRRAALYPVRRLRLLRRPGGVDRAAARSRDARRPADRGPIARIVLETSGLADPRPIVEAVRDDPDLAEWLDVSEVVVLVDAQSGLQLLRGEALARAQVVSADCVILTKLDEAEEADVARLAGALSLLNPEAALFGAVAGVETPLPSADAALVQTP